MAVKIRPSHGGEGMMMWEEEEVGILCGTRSSLALGSLLPPEMGTRRGEARTNPRGQAMLGQPRLGHSEGSTASPRLASLRKKVNMCM
jgi:hypothetical protein